MSPTTAPRRPPPTPSFGPVQQIDAGLLNVGYVDLGPADWPGGPPAARLAVRHPQLRRRRPRAGRGGLPRDRPVPARLREHALPLRRDRAQRRAGGARRRRDRLPRRARDREGDRRRLDWGARTACIVAALWPERVRRARVGQRLPDRQPGGRQAAVAPRGRAPVVVPVLLRDRARPGRLRQVPAGVCEADLADRVAEMELRRRHLRSQRSLLRQPGSRRYRDSQLPLAAGTGRRRSSLRRAGEAARRRPRHHRAHDHARGRRQRRTTSGSECICREVLRAVFAPDHRGRRSDTTSRRKPRGICDAVLEVGGAT